jgi:site-specific recombinase XerD
MKQSTEEARNIARHIYGWLNEYAPSQQSSSSHTIKSYTHALSLYIGFLEIEKKIEPSGLCPGCFCRAYLEEWLIWLIKKRKSTPETCNNRLAALRAFLKYLGSREVSPIVPGTGCLTNPTAQDIQEENKRNEQEGHASTAFST